ncbi:MAG: thiosulfate oxidation carrier protein SoxY [Deinococcales bacterium]
MNRRKFLQLSGATLGAVALSSQLSSSFAQDAAAEVATPVDDVADVDNLNPALEEALGINFDALEASDLVHINAPTIAESGANVPLEIMVDVPPSDLKAIHAFVDRNPLPHIFSVSFGPILDQSYFTTRIRIAETAPIRVIAETNDGKYLLASAVTRVTVGGCG